MSDLDEKDKAELAGRCSFCAAEAPRGDREGQAVCPECGHEIGPGVAYEFRMGSRRRRPIWVGVLVYVILLMFFGSLLVWAIELVVRGWRLVGGG